MHLVALYTILSRMDESMLFRLRFRAGVDLNVG